MQNLGKDIRGSQFVRLPVDSIKEESSLVYQYFTADLMSFRNRHEIPVAQTKRILLDVLKGLKEMHDHDWVHMGINQSQLSSEDSARADIYRCEI